jgi:hypothetical protein
MDPLSEGGSLHPFSILSNRERAFSNQRSPMLVMMLALLAKRLTALANIRLGDASQIYTHTRALSLPLSLLTDDPQKDDNGENDVVQEPTERVHAGLTAVMLEGGKAQPAILSILSRNNRRKAAYRRATSVSARKS